MNEAKEQGNRTEREFRCKDDPEANGRRPDVGEQRYSLLFPLEDGSDLKLHMGREGMTHFEAFIAQMMVDDFDGRVESTPMHEARQAALLSPSSPSPVAQSAEEETKTAGLLEALKSLRSFMWSEGYADQTPAMAKAGAAIARASNSPSPVVQSNEKPVQVAHGEARGGTGVLKEEYHESGAAETHKLHDQLALLQQQEPPHLVRERAYLVGHHVGSTSREHTFEADVPPYTPHPAEESK